MIAKTAKTLESLKTFKPATRIAEVKAALHKAGLRCPKRLKAAPKTKKAQDLGLRCAGFRGRAVKVERFKSGGVGSDQWVLYLLQEVPPCAAKTSPAPVTRVGKPTLAAPSPTPSLFLDGQACLKRYSSDVCATLNLGEAYAAVGSHADLVCPWQWEPMCFMVLEALGHWALESRFFCKPCKRASTHMLLAETHGVRLC